MDRLFEKSVQNPILFSISNDYAGRDAIRYADSIMPGQEGDAKINSKLKIQSLANL